MHIVLTNFAKTLIWKHGYDVKLWRHNSAYRILMTTICHWMKTPPWEFFAYATDNEQQKRKYSKIYSKFEFTFMVNNGLDMPLCVLCQKTLGNNSIKPSLLALTSGVNLTTIQRPDFFKPRETVFKQQRLDKVGMCLQHTNASLQVSYEVPPWLPSKRNLHSKLSLAVENVTKFWGYMRTCKVSKGYRWTKSVGTPALAFTFINWIRELIAQNSDDNGIRLYARTFWERPTSEVSASEQTSKVSDRHWIERAVLL